MGRKPGLAAGAFARQVMQTVVLLRQEAGLTNVDVVRLGNFSQNYLYIRLRGEAPLDLNDLEQLATILGISPENIVALAAGLRSGDVGWSPMADPMELGRRLRFLVEDAPDASSVAQALGEEFLQPIHGLTDELWIGMMKGSDDAPESQRLLSSRRLLSAIATRFSVPVAYLTDFGSDEVKDRTEAEVALQRALRRSGGSEMPAAELAKIPVSTLRLLTWSIASPDRV
jgi:transcriptional regulator with XRE-family HTH domain